MSHPLPRRGEGRGGGTSPHTQPRVLLYASLALAVACGGSDRRAGDESADDPSTATAADTAPRLQPKPGADLDGPIPPPDPSPPIASAGRAAPLDLGEDRHVVRVSVPTLPRGGSTTFTFGDQRQAWTTRVPDSRQLPAVAYGDGKVYISGGFDSVSFYGLDAETGRIEWATTNLEDNGPTAAVYEDEEVIFNTESCTLFVLDAETGKRLWFKYLGDPTLAQAAVSDGLVYAAHPEESAGHTRLSAFRVKNGARRWSRYVSGELLATPVVAGDYVYAATIHGVLYKFHKKTGKKAWHKRLRATTAPWIDGDEVFISRRVHTKKKKGEEQIVLDAETGDVLRTHHVKQGRYLHDVPRDLDDWRKVWAFEGSRPVVSRGVRYVAVGGEIHATDARTGDPLWVRRYAPAADERSVGTVALAGPQLVVATREGEVFGLDVDTGYTLWSYDIGRKVVAQPIVARGWAYLSTVDGYVVALRVGDESLDGWHMFGGNPAHNGPVI